MPRNLPELGGSATPCPTPELIVQCLPPQRCSWGDEETHCVKPAMRRQRSPKLGPRTPPPSQGRDPQTAPLALPRPVPLCRLHKHQPTRSAKEALGKRTGAKALSSRKPSWPLLPEFVSSSCPSLAVGPRGCPFPSEPQFPNVYSGSHATQHGDKYMRQGQHCCTPVHKHPWHPLPWPGWLRPSLRWQA